MDIKTEMLELPKVLLDRTLVSSFSTIGLR